MFSSPATRPIQVGIAAVSKSQGVSPLRVVCSAASVGVRPLPRQVVVVNCESRGEAEGGSRQCQVNQVRGLLSPAGRLLATILRCGSGGARWVAERAADGGSRVFVPFSRRETIDIAARSIVVMLYRMRSETRRRVWDGVVRSFRLCQLMTGRSPC